MYFRIFTLIIISIHVLNGFVIKNNTSLNNLLYSRTSIETVIHTGDSEDYDVNSVQYRKAKYWREKSIPELEEEIRRVRKVLAKIEQYRKVRNPDLRPNSLRNAKKTLAQLLFLRHEHHLNSLRQKLKDENKKES